MDLTPLDASLFLNFSPMVLFSPVFYIMLLFYTGLGCVSVCFLERVSFVNVNRLERGLFLNERCEGSRYTCSSE